MPRPLLAAALVMAALAFTACSKAGQQAGLADDAAAHRQVLAYLSRHPDVIAEAQGRYLQEQHAKAMAEAGKVIAEKRQVIERDPRDFVANPAGKITVVEFFDYRCPYCKAALPALQGLIRDNKDVRFVFKEFPILPDEDGRIGLSLRAARAAMAAERQGKYLQVHDAMMSARPLDDDGIAKALKDAGVQPPSDEDIPQDRQRLSDVYDLAKAIGATGTPTFVVNGAEIEGNRMDELAAAIARAR